MRLPIQSQPIARKISMAKIIRAKGIFKNGNPLPECLNCLGECKKLKGDLRVTRCLLGCGRICADAGISNVLTIFKDL